MPDIELPTAFFVPWTKLENPTHLKGRSFDFTRPIYRAFIPEWIEPWEYKILPLFDGDEMNEDLIHNMIIRIIESDDHIIMLGEEDVLINVLGKIQRTKLDAGGKVILNICFTNDMPSTETKSFAVQYLEELTAVDFLEEALVFSGNYPQ